MCTQQTPFMHAPHPSRHKKSLISLTYHYQQHKHWMSFKLVFNESGFVASLALVWTIRDQFPIVLVPSRSLVAWSRAPTCSYPSMAQAQWTTSREHDVGSWRGRRPGMRWYGREEIWWEPMRGRWEERSTGRTIFPLQLTEQPIHFLDHR